MVSTQEQEELEEEWRSLGMAPVPLERRVFVSRNLRFDQLKLVGFDMDYTLAIYHRERIEELAFHKTLERLVSRKGYPEEICGLRYDPAFVIRGLVVDRQRGNILKANRHGHVGRCYHGRTPLSRQERHQAYRRDRASLSDTHFAWVDTLFSLPEACLYASIIEHLEQQGKKVDYPLLYDDIRESIDEVHRDGSLKAVLMEDLGHYVMRDPELGPTLHRLRSSGKRLFLATNSFWEYTDALMAFLLNNVLPEYPSWRSYFDVVIVGAHKPGFFRERSPFLDLDDSGKVLGAASKLERGKIYQGGNVVDLEVMTGVQGDQVLYVGDHIHGDIVRSKKSSHWRTCLVVQELEEETRHLQQHHPERNRLRELNREAARLDVLINQLKYSLSTAGSRPAPGVALLAAAGETVELLTPVDTSMPLEAGDSSNFSKQSEISDPFDALDSQKSREPLKCLEALDSTVPLESTTASDSSNTSDSHNSLEARVGSSTPDVLEKSQEERQRLQTSLEIARKQLRSVIDETKRLEAEIESASNPYWGLVFKEGRENSLFGEQVRDYACIYTSRVSNLLYYSPQQYFRAAQDLMPHEIAVSRAEHQANEPEPGPIRDLGLREVGGGK